MDVMLGEYAFLDPHDTFIAGFVAAANRFDAHAELPGSL